VCVGVVELTGLSLGVLLGVLARVVGYWFGVEGLCLVLRLSFCGIGVLVVCPDWEGGRRRKRERYGKLLLSSQLGRRDNQHKEASIA